MIVDVPFTYVATIIRPRHRNSEEVRVRDREPVKIPEFTDAQAPVVARLTTPYSQASTLYRFQDGAFWTPGTVRAEALPEALRFEHYGPLKVQCPDLGLLRLDRDEPVREWLSDDRAAYVKQVRERAAALIIVDGLLCRRCPPPSWHISHGPISAGVNAQDKYEPSLHTYRADRLDDALAHSRALHVGSRHTYEGVRGRIEVFHPEAFAAIDDDWQAFRKVAGDTLRGAENVVGRWPRNLVLAYLDLRDGLAALPDDHPFDAALVDLARPLADPEVCTRFGTAKMAEMMRRIDGEFSAPQAAAEAVAAPGLH